MAEKNRAEDLAKERTKAAQDAMDELATYTAAVEHESAKVQKEKDVAQKIALKNMEQLRFALEKAEEEKIALQKYSAVEAITEKNALMDSEDQEVNKDDEEEEDDQEVSKRR